MRTFASCLKFMKQGIYILFATLLLVSCSDFQKALKSEDVAKKLHEFISNEKESSPWAQQAATM